MPCEAKPFGVSNEPKHTRSFANGYRVMHSERPQPGALLDSTIWHLNSEKHLGRIFAATARKRRSNAVCNLARAHAVVLARVI